METRRWILLAMMVWMAPVQAQQMHAQRELAMQALRADEAGEAAVALGHYQQLLALDAKDVWVLHSMARLYGLQQNFSKCIEYARRGIKLKSDYQALIFNVLGSCQDEAGKNRDAVKTFAKGVKLFPKDGVLNYGYGVALLRQGQIGKALGPLQVAIEETPEFSSPYLTYAAVLRQLGSQAGQALMGLRFLMVEPESERAMALVKVINQSLLESSARYETSVANHVSLIGLMLHKELVEFDLIFPGVAAKARAAAQERNLNASDQFVWSIAALLTVMARDAGSRQNEGFVWSRAYTSLNTLSERGVLDTYLYHVAAIGQLAGAQDWLDAHPSDVRGLAKVMDEFPGGRLHYSSHLATRHNNPRN